MASNTGISAGPADSQLARILFYLADGIMAGALLYFSVIFISSIISTAVSDLFSTAELVIFSFIITVGLAIAARNLWAHLSLARTQRTPPVYEDWKAIRRWTGVALIAIPVAAILAGITLWWWSWELALILPEVRLLGMWSLALGLILRIFLRHAVSNEDGPVFLPGTRRGLIGFVVLLTGLLAILVWGGVPIDVLGFAALGIGGYVFLYLLAAAGLD